MIAKEQLDAIVAAGLSAPSGDNSQPWSIERSQDSDGFVVRFVPERGRSLLDVREIASRISLGALLESMRLAAAQRGFRLSSTVHADTTDPTRWATVELEPDAPVAEDLAAVIHERHTNRLLFDRSPLGDEARAALLAETRASDDVAVRLLEGSAIASIASLVGRAESLRAGLRAANSDLSSWLRWTQEEVERTRDGLDVRTLEMTGFERWILKKMSASWRLASIVLPLGGAAATGKWSKARVESSSALAVFAVPTVDAQHGVALGRVLQRIWLRVTQLGLKAGPMAALPLLGRGADLGLPGVAPAGPAIIAIRDQLITAAGLPAGHTPLFILRIGRAAPAEVRALRRKVEDVVTSSGQ